MKAAHMGDYDYQLPNGELNAEQTQFLITAQLLGIATEFAKFGSTAEIERYRAHMTQVDTIFGDGATIGASNAFYGGWTKYDTTTREVLGALGELITAANNTSSGSFIEDFNHFYNNDKIHEIIWAACARHGIDDDQDLPEV